MSYMYPFLSIEAGRPNFQINHEPRRLRISPSILSVLAAISMSLLSFVALSASQMSLTPPVHRAEGHGGTAMLGMI